MACEVPGGQAEHPEAPGFAWKKPAEQDVQAEAKAAEYVPAAHGEQLTAPVPIW